MTILCLRQKRSTRILPLPPLSLGIQIDVLRRANLEDEVYQVAAMDDTSQLASGFEFGKQFLLDLGPKLVRLLSASSNSKLESFLGVVFGAQIPKQSRLRIRREFVVFLDVFPLFRRGSLGCPPIIHRLGLL